LGVFILTGFAGIQVPILRTLMSIKGGEGKSFSAFSALFVWLSFHNSIIPRNIRHVK
jgi:hypothetical protein